MENNVRTALQTLSYHMNKNIPVLHVVTTIVTEKLNSQNFNKSK